MRGSADFTVMKGFMDEYTVKGDGQTPETLPEDTGADITETAELDDGGASAPKAANIKKTDNTPAGPGTTMDDELADLPEKAEEDIADGYVSDSQHLPGPGTRAKKGYEAFNEMVNKGVVADDYGLNVHNIEAAFDTIEKSAEAEFNAAAGDLSDWYRPGDGMTVFKGVSAAEMVYKGDPEDEGVDEALAETPDRGPMEQASDDTEGVHGENDSTPQTEEAEEEDQEDSNAETGLVGEPEEKGWQSFNAMVEKGFVVEEKGPKWDAVKAGARKVWETVRQPIEATREGGSRIWQSGAKAGLKNRRVFRGKYRQKLGSAIENRPGVALGIAGAAAAGGAGYGGYRYYKSRKNKGYEDYNAMVEKGFVVEEKGVRDAASRAWGAVKRAGKATGEHVKRHKGKYAVGAGTAAAAGSVYGGYRIGRYRVAQAIGGRKKKRGPGNSR